MELSERISAVTESGDRAVQRFGPAVLRIGAGLLWLSNVSWKLPPDFGRSSDGCRGLCAYVAAGVEHPVLPGSAWIFREVVSPNLAAFGWITLFSEAVLAALLLSGRHLRAAAALGIAQSLGILVAVANADHEWYWSYLLMVLVHLGVWLSAASAEPPRARTAAAWVAAYGIVVAVANAQRGVTGGSGDWLLFGSRTDLPGDFGRNVFPGSIALGIIFLALAAGLFVADRWGASRRRIVGWSLVAVSAIALLTYGADGTIFGLGARASSVAVLGAVAVVLLAPTDRGDSAS